MSSFIATQKSYRKEVNLVLFEANEESSKQRELKTTKSENVPLLYTKLKQKKTNRMKTHRKTKKKENS